MHRTVARYKQTGALVDCSRSGHPRDARTENVVRAVRARIQRNPLRKQKIMSREMNVAPRTMSRIMRDDLGLRAYKRYIHHLLKDKLNQIHSRESL